jgi:hypothetical protein
MAGQQERKESRAAMAGRQNGKREEKGKGKEVEEKKVGQRFCTVFSAQESGERLVRVFESLVNHSLMIPLCLFFSPLYFDCLKMK